MNKILTIGNDAFLLSETTTDADLLKLLTILGTAKRVDLSGNYIPNAETRYGETVIVIKPSRRVEVEIKITGMRVLAESAYNAEHAAGSAAFLTTHPEGKEGLVHA